MNFPVFSQLARKLGFRDEFAPDCLLQRRVEQTSPANVTDARSRIWRTSWRAIASPSPLLRSAPVEWRLISRTSGWFGPAGKALHERDRSGPGRVKWRPGGLRCNLRKATPEGGAR